MLWKIKSLGIWIRASAGVKVGSPLTAIWSFPSVIGLAMLIAWAAEATQFLFSGLHYEVTYIYFGWAIYKMGKVALGYERFDAFLLLPKVLGNKEGGG